MTEVVATQPSALQRRCAKILSLRPFEDASLVDAMNALSSSFDSDKLINDRRNFKSLVDSETLALHQYISQHMTASERAMNTILSTLDRIDDDLDKAAANIRAFRQESNQAFTRSTQLHSNLQAAESKLTIIESFKPALIPSEDLITTLTSSDSEVDATYIASLEQLTRLHSAAKSLLNVCGQQVLGVELQALDAELLEKGYNRVYNQIQQYTTDDPSSLTAPLQALSSRQDLYARAVKDVAKSRGSSIASSITQFLRDSTFQASIDSVRYVADILALLQTLASAELQTFQTLKIPECAVVLDGAIAESGSWEMIEQAVDSLPPVAPLEVLRISRLLLFFALKSFNAILGVASTTVAAAHALGVRMQVKFLDQVRSKLSEARQRPVECRVPMLLCDAVFLIDEAVRLSADVEDDITTDLIVNLVDLSLSFAERLSSQLEESDRPVFLLNCLTALQTPLKRHAPSVPVLQRVIALMDGQMASLVQSHGNAVVERLGLMDKLSVIRKGGQLQHVTLAAMIRGFYSSLFSLGAGLDSSIVERLSARELRNEARVGIARAVADAYEELYNAIKDEGIAPHTPTQVRALLDL